MPKEIVRRGDDTALHVGWGHLSHVQVGIESEAGFYDEVDPDEDYDSIWVTLTSGEEVDKLIKVLKKARKQAFPDGNS